ncbi:CcdB family protein [Caenimonas aquaedulcis]|uniref:Toxin CcdB n=1 Tax=Caenimonas aquaedulcis TaxID=2793270 RepID=A0A931H3W8_9BURK|nr:CcdB family protein [Caenimonas aquaedulcis]MBG9388146.1 CcdB family protein [Caenimonas aquaedulcis]
MAQFDIYLNPIQASRESVPYVADVQSGLLERLPTRLVMPLSRVGADVTRLPENLCPVVQVDGETLILLAHQAAPLPARMLRKPVASISHRAGEVAAAMDAILSGF